MRERVRRERDYLHISSSGRKKIGCRPPELGEGGLAAGSSGERARRRIFRREGRPPDLGDGGPATGSWGRRVSHGS
jgi:hypothetical protein